MADRPTNEQIAARIVWVVDRRKMWERDMQQSLKDYILEQLAELRPEAPTLRITPLKSKKGLLWPMNVAFHVNWLGGYKAVGACFLTAVVLGGCCTYQGKAVSKREAARMKSMGMAVQCP